VILRAFPCTSEVITSAISISLNKVRVSVPVRGPQGPIVKCCPKMDILLGCNCLEEYGREARGFNDLSGVEKTGRFGTMYSS
jgi:hypothetical protein